MCGFEREILEALGGLRPPQSQSWERGPVEGQEAVMQNAQTKLRSVSSPTQFKAKDRSQRPTERLPSIQGKLDRFLLGLILSAGEQEHAQATRATP